MAGPKVIDIEQVLKKSIDEPFEIVYEESGMLTTPGEHYGSIMLAIDVKIKLAKDGSEKLLNLAAKLPPANEMLRQAFDVQSTFRKEIFAYTEMLPAIVDFQKEFGVPEEESIARLFPKFVGARLNLDEERSDWVDDGAVILFENLKARGYRTADRLVGLDFLESQMILRDLAEFHGTTVALRKLRPELFEEKVMAYTRIGNDAYDLPVEFLAALRDAVLDGVKKTTSLRPYLKRIEEVCSRGIARPVPDETWATICHADFWLSNTMLLKSDTGIPIECKIFDLQLAVYSTALTDLVFFLLTSVTSGVLDEFFNDFLKVYYDRFIETLKYYEIDTNGAYGWESFAKEVDIAGRIEACHILMMLKPICTERGTIKNSLDNFQNSDWSRKNLLGPNHRRKLEDTVLTLIRKQWI